MFKDYFPPSKSVVGGLVVVAIIVLGLSGYWLYTLDRKDMHKKDCKSDEKGTEGDDCQAWIYSACRAGKYGKDGKCSAKDSGWLTASLVGVIVGVVGLVSAGAYYPYAKKK